MSEREKFINAYIHIPIFNDGGVGGDVDCHSYYSNDVQIKSEDKNIK